MEVALSEYNLGLFIVFNHFSFFIFFRLSVIGE